MEEIDIGPAGREEIKEMMPRSEIIARRRAFRLPGYATLADVQMDGDYVSPLQVHACSPTGPVLLAYNWLDVPSVKKHWHELRREGYLASMPFNQVIGMALAACDLKRADVYMTQAFHLLPLNARSESIPQRDVDASFEAITRYEIAGRKVIVLGDKAARACMRHGVRPDQIVPHPSARNGTYEQRAAVLAAAIRAVLPSQKGSPAAPPPKKSGSGFLRFLGFGGRS